MINSQDFVDRLKKNLLKKKKLQPFSIATDGSDSLKKKTVAMLRKMNPFSLDEGQCSREESEKGETGRVQRADEIPLRQER